MIALATSSTQPNKADCSKYFICLDQVDKLMLCVKTQDSGLNTFFKLFANLGDVRGLSQ